MKDNYGRTIDYMRISITDRCNLRCKYCMPNGVELVSMEEILTYEEIEQVAACAAEEGIRKLKVTGGEPLVRRGCVEFIGRLKQISGIEQVTLTTNGVLLGTYAAALADAGLNGVNISLDSLDRENYQAITGRDELGHVLEGLEAALEAGLKVKVNAVLQKGGNDTEWEALLQLAKRYPVDVRFIEMMPIGYGKQFEPVSNEELLEKLKQRYPGTEPDLQVHGNGPAHYYRIPGFLGSVGFISAIHGKFCKSCNRIRLTAQGQLKPCLCYGEAYDLRKILRGEGGFGKPEEKKTTEEINTTDAKKATDEINTTEEINTTDAIRRVLREAIAGKPEQHCFEEVKAVTEEKQMVQIGG